jgi:dihydrodiol dehydrogenase / D-xylose 1-dehydrogenase (NADP)
MAPLRWGIASAGRISNDFCAALSTLPSDDHQVVAVAARSLDSARTFAATFEIPKFYEGYRQLAEDSDVGELLVTTT